MVDVRFKVVCTNNLAPLEMEGTSRRDVEDVLEGVEGGEEVEGVVEVEGGEGGEEGEECIHWHISSYV